MNPSDGALHESTGAGSSKGKGTGKLGFIRGSKACSECRRVKMRCEGAENGSRCKRCRDGDHECIFLESKRGRQYGQKAAAMAKSLQRVEATLETVLQSISHPQLLLPRPVPIAPASLDAPLAFPNSFTVPAAFGPSSTIPEHIPTPPILLAGGGEESILTEDTMDAESPVLHSLPEDSSTPLGLLVEASMLNQQQRKRRLAFYDNGGTETPNDRPAKSRKIGIANNLYFQSGSLSNMPVRRLNAEPRETPAILAEGLVSPAEAEELFDLYFSKCHPGCPVLDRQLHTPSGTPTRSSLLFTCICAVAARYYTKRTDDLYSKCMRAAKQMAFDVVAKGFKSVDICQAFLLLCHWNEPAERFEQERAYQLAGIAFRMAADLNLNRRINDRLSEETSIEVRLSYEREILNRERCWLNCFRCDNSMACQMGKLNGISREDSIIRSVKAWHQQRTSQKSDRDLCALVDLLRIIRRILDTVYSDTEAETGLNITLDYPMVLYSFLKQLDQWKDDWLSGDPKEVQEIPDDDVAAVMRKFYYLNSRLLLLTFGVQHALKSESKIDLPRYCVSSLKAAAEMLDIVSNYLAPKGHLRHATDSLFIYVAFGCCFLLKLIGPGCAPFVETDKAMELILKGVAALESAAVDETHTPALYASFIRALLESRKSGSRSVFASRAQTRAGSPIEHGSAQESNEICEPLIGIDSYFGGLLGDQLDFMDDPMMADDYDPLNLTMDDSFWSNILAPDMAPGLLHGLSGEPLFKNADPWVTESSLNNTFEV